MMQTIAERERMEEERLAEQAREQERLKSRKVLCTCESWAVDLLPNNINGCSYRSLDVGACSTCIICSWYNEQTVGSVTS